jgi:hypothetical protein
MKSLGLVGLSNLGSVLLTLRLAGAEFPEDLAENAEGEFGVSGGEVQATDKAADFFFGRGGGAPFVGTSGARF